MRKYSNFRIKPPWIDVLSEANLWKYSLSFGEWFQNILQLYSQIIALGIGGVDGVQLVGNIYLEAAAGCGWQQRWYCGEGNYFAEYIRPAVGQKHQNITNTQSFLIPKLTEPMQLGGITKGLLLGKGSRTSVLSRGDGGGAVITFFCEFAPKQCTRVFSKENILFTLCGVLNILMITVMIMTKTSIFSRFFCEKNTGGGINLMLAKRGEVAGQDSLLPSRSPLSPVHTCVN